MDRPSQIGPPIENSSAIVLFSGGQDSTTVLAWALDRFERVETVGFAYGQKHIVEMDQRPKVRDSLRRLSVAWDHRLGPDHVVQLDLINQIAANIPRVEKFGHDQGSFLGGRYIPGRNLMMLAMTASIALRRDIRVLACGASETEYSGYPDCRRSSIDAIQYAIRASAGLAFTIECPLMNLDKAGVWRLAESLGGDALVQIVREQTHTCYSGDRSNLSDWGYGCGNCDACRLRQKGWIGFRGNTVQRA